MLSLESPGALARGETGVQVDGASHSATWEGAIDNGALRVRHGFGFGIEGSVETSVMWYRDLDLVPRYAILNRVGLKYCFDDIHGCPIALTGGVGGGAYDQGGVAGGDLGLLLGYDNPYFVPFFHVRATVTAVFGPAPVYDGDAYSCSTTTQTCPVYNTPTGSYGFFGTLGFRIPISFGEESGTRLGLLAAIQLGSLQDDKTGEIVGSVGGGVEITFGGPTRGEKAAHPDPDEEGAR